MARYQASVRQNIRNLMENLDYLNMNLNYHFISFHHDASYSDDLDKLSLTFGSTNIEGAFSLLKTKVLNLKPDIAIIVFISDGCDDKPKTIEARLNELGGIKDICKSVLFSIAIGSKFPTSMVVDSLRLYFHSASDTLPVVFPIKSLSGCSNAFEGLFHYIKNQNFFENLEFYKATTELDIDERINAIYNNYIVKCIQKKNGKMYKSLLKEALVELENLIHNVQALQPVTDLVKITHLPKCLPSLLMKYNQTINNRLEEKLKETIISVNRLLKTNEYLFDLSDIDKQDLLSFGSNFGRNVTKTVVYQTPQFKSTIETLQKCLQLYSSAEEAQDMDISDSKTNQAEIYMDAKSAILGIGTIRSMERLIEVFPIIGRPIQIQKFDKWELNPYLIEVKAIDVSLRYINSVDLYCLNNYKGVGNCLMPITKNNSRNNVLCNPCGSHLTTYFVSKVPPLKFDNCLHALLASSITYILQSDGEYDEVMDDIFQTYQSVYCGVPTFEGYLELLKTSEFRAALVTVSGSTGTVQKCPHLTKFVLGLFVLIKQGHQFSTETMQEMQDALLVEMAGRGAGILNKIENYCKLETDETIDEIFARISIEETLDMLNLSDAQACAKDIISGIFEQDSNRRRRKSQLFIKPIRFSFDLNVELRYHQFNVNSVGKIFTKLNVLCGNPYLDFQIKDSDRFYTIINHGLQNSSYDRNIINIQIQPLDMSNVLESLTANYHREIEKKFMDYVTKSYVDHSTMIHYITRPFPAEYCKMFNEAYRIDLIEYFGISPETLLPTNACASPNCSHFLKRLSPTRYNQEGLPTLSTELQSHLQNANTIPAHHRIVHDLNDNGNETVENLKMEMKSGDHLKCSDMVTKYLFKLPWVFKTLDDKKLDEAIAFHSKCYSDHESTWTYDKFLDALQTVMKFPR
ncbi:hypothetical protein HDV02_002839 [Globomyces sp. JEL0801]|nr:hypothetical protein HDV02_002839 [Globomyces sp. JEL0801]